MNLKNRIEAFHKLGQFLTQFSHNPTKIEDLKELNSKFYEEFDRLIKNLHHSNGWFKEENVLFAIESWAYLLNEERLHSWMSNYEIKEVDQKRIALITAGNIPLVGFHDFLSVLIVGHSVKVKLSSKDNKLLPYIAKILEEINSSFINKIEFTEERLNEFDAVIATGSNNTARYFEYYFKNKPSVIRHNRNSVAILTGDESSEELEALSEDIFRYYGLGCRNVSKLFVPKDYDFDNFFKGIYKWHPIIHDAKYANNYDYNKAVYLMSEYDLLENGFLILKQDLSYSSPIATLFYEYYENLEDLSAKLKEDGHLIQCTVGKDRNLCSVKFGDTQKPALDDYADGIDIVDFLLKI